MTRWTKDGPSTARLFIETLCECGGTEQGQGEILKVRGVEGALRRRQVHHRVRKEAGARQCHRVHRLLTLSPILRQRLKGHRACLRSIREYFLFIWNKKKRT